MTNTYTLGALNLSDPAAYVVESHNPGTPDMRSNLRIQTLQISVRGTTVDETVANLAAIQSELRKAQLAAAPNSGRDPVTLVLQPGTTGQVTYDVLLDANGDAGVITIGPQAFSTIALGYMRLIRLTLTTAAYGRGDRLVATNLALDSGDLTTDSYTLTNLTASANSQLAPNGDTVATTLHETTTNGAHSITQSFTKAASEITYTFPLYVAPDGRDYVDLALQDSTGDNGVSATFNISTGTVTTAATAFGTGWTAVASGAVERLHDYDRVWIAATIPAAVTAFDAVLALRSDADTTAYAGATDKGVTAWGWAVQPAASQPGPYLETGASLTITNGDDAQHYLFDLPGDVPGLSRLTVSDQSTNGVVINGWRAGQMPVTFPGDYDGIIPITPETAASTSETGTIAANIAQVIATPQAQRLGTATKPSGAPYTDGPLHVFGRVRDTTSTIGKPTNLTATAGAIATVQQQIVIDSDDHTSATVTFAQAPASGNLLRAAVAVGHLAAITTPSGWTAGPTKTEDATGTAAEFYKVSDGTETSVTFSFSVSGTSTVLFEEVQGIKASSPLDVSATSSSSTSDSTPDTGTTSATAQANEYAVGVILYGNTLGGSGGTNWNNGYTRRMGDFGRRNFFPLTMANKVLTATGTQTTGFTTSNPSTYAAYIVTYKGLTTAAPSLPAGSYTIIVVPVDANGVLGAPSDPLSVTLDATGSFSLRWGAADSGPSADHYRVYWLRDGQPYKYFATPDDTPQFALTTETSPTGTEDPPLTAPTRGQFRLLVSLTSGSRFVPGRWWPSGVANNEWEMLYLGILPGTGQPTRWGADALGWQIALEAKHDSAAPQLAADAFVFFPAKHPLLNAIWQDASGQFGGLDTASDWVYDLRPDFQSSQVLYTSGTSTEAGSFLADGQFRMGPAALVLTLMPVIGSLVSDVTDCKYELALEYTPLFEYLASS